MMQQKRRQGKNLRCFTLLVLFLSVAIVLLAWLTSQPLTTLVQIIDEEQIKENAMILPKKPSSSPSPSSISTTQKQPQRQVKQKQQQDDEEGFVQLKNPTRNKVESNVTHTGLESSLTTMTMTTTTKTVSDTSQLPPSKNLDHSNHVLHDKYMAVPPPIYNETTLSICLLLKDDNDILNEWIAYHYHAVNLRHLIVAHDPYATTAPKQIFQRWMEIFPDLIIEEWYDIDYMPKYFLEGRYDEVPSYLPTFITENISASIWHKDSNNNTIYTLEEIQQDLTHINNHRFRQVTFVSKCFQYLRGDDEVLNNNIQTNNSKNSNKNDDNSKTAATTTYLRKSQTTASSKKTTAITTKNGRKAMTKNWVAHIDTDEYLVINPRVRLRPRAVQKKKNHNVTVPSHPYAGSVLQFVEEMFEHYPKRLTRKCLMMPTIFFGSVETLPTEHDEKNNEMKTTTTTTTITTDYMNYDGHINYSISSKLQNIVERGNTNQTIFLPNHMFSSHHVDNAGTSATDTDKKEGRFVVWNYTKFETLRWRVHANFSDIANGLQKAIVDVSTLSKKHSIFTQGHVKSVHQPLEYPECRRMTLKPEIDAVRLFPLAVQHYIGSLERYLSRNDKRRNEQIYNHRAKNVVGGIDDGWIQSWLYFFILQHGPDKVSKVLHDYTF